MSLDPGAVRARLPNVGEYLLAIWNLGKRSMRPALPALMFIYFYRLGLGAYRALSDYTYPEGPGAFGRLIPQLALFATFLPVLLLIYTPFLPLQDSLLRGEPMSFLRAIRRVLEVSWNFMLSGIIQVMIFLVPVGMIGIIGAVLLPEGSTSELSSARLFIFSLVLLMGLFWTLFAALFMIFATPAVVLDDEGPVQSLRTSFRLVTRHLGGILGRFLSFSFVMIVIYVMALLPAGILLAVERTAGVSSAPIKIAAEVWSSAVATLFFPFWVASLMVLYRALVRPAAEPRGVTAVPLDDELRPAVAARAPFE